MSIRLVKQICDLQGISLRLEAIVICPYCNCRTARIQINMEKWECIRCHKKGNLDELLRLCEEEWLDRHKFWDNEAKSNKGVQLR